MRILRSKINLTSYLLPFTSYFPKIPRTHVQGIFVCKGLNRYLLLLIRGQFKMLLLGFTPNVPRLVNLIFRHFIRQSIFIADRPIDFF